ncbi:MAG: peptidase M10A and M12B matrixin and adamalysin [Elusimicrobia bacterium]|nr:MAG: peptidase M10A and M12B matrixin and adamalysin [Elusimicrobiota bacterium]KAF0154613.1 MAG: peptidase M10A and M12B matrixin and adamalysin [Elusimicrobiota bacterium]
MRRTIDWILLIATLAFAAWYWHSHRDQLRVTGRLMRAAAFPCSSPITWSVGAVDPRYGLSENGFADYVRAASAVWEIAYGRDLFEFVRSSGDLSVSMVYDQRQAAIDKLKTLGLRTDRTAAAYESLKVRYDEISARMEPRRKTLEARAAAYKAGEAEYNSVVGEYNRIGRATPAQKRIFESARAKLAGEYAAMKRLENGVNGDIDTLNALATAINQLIVDLNMEVKQYNRAGSVMGVYEEGVYKVTDGERVIEIYKFHDRAQLVLLLAHEMGHALGLEHVEDQEALMSAFNRGKSLELLPADLAELDRACTPPLRRGLSRLLRREREK